MDNQIHYCEPCSMGANAPCQLPGLCGKSVNKNCTKCGHPRKDHLRNATIRQGEIVCAHEGCWCQEVFPESLDYSKRGETNE